MAFSSVAFSSLKFSLVVQKSVSFVKSHVSVVGLISCANGILFRDSFPCLYHVGYSLCFLFVVSVFLVSFLGL